MAQIVPTPKRAEKKRLQGELMGIQHYRHTFLGGMQTESKRYPDGRQLRMENSLTLIQKA